MIQCLPNELTNEDVIYSYLLSKQVGDVTSDILQISADRSNPPTFQKITWYESSLQGRGNTTGTTLVPSVNSTLMLTVKATEVSCKDSAKFICKVVISGGRSAQDSAQLNVVGKSFL
ncbi:Hypothetical predicted protein [Mytilus galloprovincialis]|nr:Hypothetical predicted protein [Mytilus galloprovincialis]